MKRTKFSVVLDLWISLVINVILSIVLPLLAIGMITPAIFLKGFVIAFIVSTAFVFIVPVIRWGDHFAALFKVKPHTLPSQLISSLLTALCLSLLMSALMTAVFAGIGPWFLDAWLPIYPYAFLAVYLSLQIALFTGLPIARAICGVPKMPPQPAHSAEQKQEPDQAQAQPPRE
ncbi:hypothetical protein SDC9_154841 [bioreactor metagenome]|uniref:DUF2798 domain-containing protein n=1 Tax=bioreactor metagenome TaxID=1076179 RepID=A0A645F1D7_9ZZZZ